MLSTFGRRSLAASRQTVRCVSVWSNVPAGPPDPILGMSMTLKELTFFPAFCRALNVLNRGHRGF